MLHCFTGYVISDILKSLHQGTWFIDIDLQGDKKGSVHLMITLQKVTSNVQCLLSVSRHPAKSDCLASDCEGQGDTRLTLMPSVIPNSNYVIMVR
jgi:hypothetical protein